MIKFLNWLESFIYGIWLWGVGGDIALISYQYYKFGETDLFFIIWASVVIVLMVFWMILRGVNHHLHLKIIRELEENKPYIIITESNTYTNEVKASHDDNEVNTDND